MKRLILTYTQSCNLTCDFCYVTFSNKRTEDKSIQIIERAISLKFDIITFGGGDSFSKKYFRDSCILAKKNGIITHVDTNCLAIKPTDLNFIIDNIDILGVSLDGTEDIHNSMRKSKNLFLKVDKILKNLQRLNYKVKINTVVTNQNKNNLECLFLYLNKFTNLSYWSLYQFFPLDAAIKNKNIFEVSDSDFDIVTQNFQSKKFRIEKFKYTDRISGYIFCDEIGNVYTNSIDCNYSKIGSIFDSNIDQKLKSMNLDINPKVIHRY
ncbi:radical SAM protein [Chryseobacterium sp. MYb328]|uniref:radical SAM protein n=1 Tax=Chryseobacterium sp. MYb328 TaxID=2745231 RepID=UPI0030AD4BE4